jgi:hypothetical protein
MRRSTGRCGTQACNELNGVRACIVGGLPDVDILYVWVHAPAQPKPMLLEIGLAGSGGMARTVLDSLQSWPASCPPNRVCTNTARATSRAARDRQVQRRIDLG